MISLFGGLEENTSTKLCNTKVLNTAKLKREGFKVIDRGNFEYKIKPVKKSLKAKLVGLGGNNFIKRVIMDCVGKECELQDPAEANLWEVEQLVDGSILIKRKRGGE